MTSTASQSIAELAETSRLQPLRSTIDQLTEAISIRRRMREHNLQALLYREVELDTLIMRLHQGMPVYMEFLTCKTRQNFEKQLSELKAEQTQEERSYWRDVAELQRDLQEQLAEYSRMKALLGEQPGYVQEQPRKEEAPIQLPRRLP